MKRAARMIVIGTLVIGISQVLAGCGVTALYCIEKQDRHGPCNWF